MIVDRTMSTLHSDSLVKILSSQAEAEIMTKALREYKKQSAGNLDLYSRLDYMLYSLEQGLNR